MGRLNVLSKMQGKRRKAEDTSRDGPCLSLILDSLGVRVPVTGLQQSTNRLVKTPHWKKLPGLLGVVDTSREYLTGGPSRSTMHATCFMNRQWDASQPLSGILHGLSWKDIKDHPAAGKVWHCCQNSGVWGGHAPWYPAGSDKSASCSLQCWGS